MERSLSRELTDGAALDPLRLAIASDADIVAARHRGRTLAESLGFTVSDRTLVATAISELARNILQYAARGEVIVQAANHGERVGITVIARDEGPGIMDVKQALEIGYSTSGGLGLGLPGVRRIMDTMDIDTEPGRGTSVTATKWKR